MATTFTATVAMAASGKSVYSGVTKAVFNKAGPMTLTISSSNDRVLLLNVPNKAVITDYFVRVEHTGWAVAGGRFALRLLQSAQNLASLSTSVSLFHMTPQMFGGTAVGDVTLPFKVSLTDSGTQMETLALDVNTGPGSSLTSTFSVIGWLEYIMDDQVLS
ncbi:MAG: hypothetical protein ACRD5H_00170 [Nitrososphaerales archaeon]